MRSGHCGHCGARSTIWGATCAFCGCDLSPASLPADRIRAAAFELPVGPCTERRRSAERRGGLRQWWSRLRQRLAVIHP